PSAQASTRSERNPPGPSQSDRRSHPGGYYAPPSDEEKPRQYPAANAQPTSQTPAKPSKRESQLRSYAKLPPGRRRWPRSGRMRGREKEAQSPLTLPLLTQRVPPSPALRARAL